MPQAYLDVTQESGAALFTRNITGEVVMLNLLRFREVADYAEFPELAPERPISGREAYQRYVEHTLPYLQEAGGEVLYLGEGGHYLIGPQSERWDLVMLVRHRSLRAFVAFAEHDAYLSGLGHRKAALADSRLLPLVAPTDEWESIP